MDLLVTVENIAVSPSPTARYLGVVLDHQSCCTENITAVAPSCRSAVYSICRIRPFLTREAAHLLVQALVISRLDKCNWLLAGLLACVKTFAAYPERSSQLALCSADLNAPMWPPPVGSSPGSFSSLYQITGRWYWHTRLSMAAFTCRSIIV